MGLERATLDVQQKVRQGKVTLARLTPNKRAEAANIGVSDTTVGRWCDPARLDENMPWQLISSHSAADELLGLLAAERNKVVVDLIQVGELNGDLGDERDQVLIHLGELTEKLRKFMTDRRTPGRISVGEAFDLLPIIEGMKRATATMEAELRGVINGDR